MIPNPWPGSHFVFDGIDGCGKSEQFNLAKVWLTNRMRAFGIAHITLAKEPGRERFWGKKIYEELTKKGGLHETNPFGFQTWYACDSLENYRNVVIPSLKFGHTILSDRSRSSMVFGAQSPDDIPRFLAMNLAILGENWILPEATFIFDVDVPTALARQAKKGRAPDEHEQAKVMLRVRPNFLALAGLYPNCHIIYAEGPPDVVFEKVKGIMERVLESKK